MSGKDTNGRGIEWVECQNQLRKEYCLGLFTPIARRGIDDPGNGDIMKISIYQSAVAAKLQLGPIITC